MTKAEAVLRIAEVGETSKSKADKIYNALVADMRKTLVAGQSVKIPGLGSITPVARNARQGHNPRTGAPISVPASKTVRLSVSRKFRKEMNGD